MGYILRATQLFYFIFFATVGALFFTHPFMKYPFDMFTLLERIEPYYSNNYAIPHGRAMWYDIWGKLFYLLHIDNTQLFLRAKIIHIIQSLISFFAVFYLSRVVFRNLFKEITPLHTNYLAYFATLIWFSIFATASVGQHLVWIQWYSLNYQITLPLALLTAALVLSLIYDSLTIKRKLFYILAVIFLSYLIINMHVMEYLYFLMYMTVLIIVNIDRIFLYSKKHPLYFALPLGFFATALGFAYPYLNKLEFKRARILQFLTPEKITQLPTQIIKDGSLLLSGFNRAFASMNELIYLSLALLGVLLLYILIRKKHLKTLNIRLFLFITITSLFVLIPINLYSAGFFSLLLNYPWVLNRLYYSSLIFLIVPLFSYFLTFLILKRHNILWTNTLTVVILFTTFLYSRFDTAHHQNFYKNIESLKHSFSEKIVGYNLSQKQREKIGEILEQIERERSTTKLYYYAREDIAYIIRKMYAKSVYLPWARRGRKLDTNFYIKRYQSSTQKNKVLFPVPEGFPDYEPYR